jgi:hypothetical protein
MTASTRGRAMSDAVDADLANRMLATMYLLEQAHDWERLARDESLEDEVRVRAALNARAIREELRPQ